MKKKEKQRGLPARPIFYDPTSHRLVFFLLLAGVFLAVVVIWFVLFFLHLSDSSLTSRTGDRPPVETQLIDDLSHSDPNIRMGGSDEKASALIPKPRSTDTLVHAFVPVWSLAGLLETKANIEDIDVLMPEWYALESVSGAIEDISSTYRLKFERFVESNRPQFELLPVVRATPHGAVASKNWLNSPSLRRELAEASSELAKKRDFDGICFNFSGSGERLVSAVASFTKELKESLGKAGKQSCIVASISDEFLAHKGLIEQVDRLIVLAFQEPGPFSGPTPLANHAWFQETLSDLLVQVPVEKLVIALGNFGLDWVSGASGPEYVSYFDAVGGIARYKGTYTLNKSSLNSAASYRDENGRMHQMWILDAASAHNQLLRIPLDRVAGIAVWPVTGGDPGIWDLLGYFTNGADEAKDILTSVRPPAHVVYTGQGPILEVAKPEMDGQRLIHIDPHTGQIVDVEYRSLPQAFTVARRGAMPEGTVVLTFDDGPSDEYTPQILDILKEYGVPAVFFVVGDVVQDHPEIALRIREEGHEIGVHTYSHPNIANVSEFRLKLELHASQELIESVVGVNTKIFRAPYGLDENPETPGDARALKVLAEEGYLVVGVEVDSNDWMRPGATEIAETVLRLVKEKKGNVILFHDAGGDRRQTVEALPVIIESLREGGIDIVPLSTITGPTHSALEDGGLSSGDDLRDVSFWLARVLDKGITSIFFLVIAAGILRSLTILTLAMIKEKRAHRSGDASLQVSVLIPAYCEELVIEKTVRAVLASDYPIAEVIVIDDGSADQTGGVVERAFGGEKRVRLVRQENRGKAEALNHGIRLVSSPVIVAIDADTIIAPQAVGMLVRHFNDERVGAVAGNVKVGNRNNPLTKLQAIEYITAQNLDRRAFEVLNGIMVIPGSIGAWRTKAVTEAGGYTSDTLVEDADMTISTIRAGYKVVYEPGACAFTEAPETIRQWMRQRLRWHFGMLQVSWKHKRAYWEGRAVGIVSIPDLVLIGAVSSIFAPVADIIAIVNVFALISSFPEWSTVAIETGPVLVAVAYIAYLLSDLLLAALAFSLEPNEDKRLLPWVLLQRFFYRQIYWMVALRSISRALTGRFTGWRKITRTASVDVAATLGASRAHHRVVTTDKVS